MDIKDIDLKKYTTPQLFDVQIEQIKIGLEHNVDVSIYAFEQFNWLQMREIRLGLEQGLEVSSYLKPLFKWHQMEQIRLGLEAGIDVSSYAKVSFSPKEMILQREMLVSEKKVFDTDSLEDVNHLLSEIKEGIPIDFSGGTLYIAHDRMSVYVELQESFSYTYEEFISLLKMNQIVQGIDHHAIQELIHKKVRNQKILVATGKEAADGVDGWYEFHVRTTLPGTPKILEDGSVDYYNMDIIESVQQNQKIVTYHNATLGVYGYTVDGTLMNPKKGIDQPPLQGYGFYRTKNGTQYFSDKNGKVTITDNNTLLVEEMIYIQGNVDVSTGNIAFQGDVYITGDVLTGFQISATGNIQICGHVEGAYINSEKNVIIRGGMNGGNTGSIHAKGDLYGNFFECCNINTTGDINANYIMNCQVYCEGKVVVNGKKGTIASGLVRALKGVDAYYIGNSSQTPTYFYCGLNNETIEKEKCLNRQVVQITKEIELLYHSKKCLEERKTASNNEHYQKILMAIPIKEEELTAKNVQLDRIRKLLKENEMCKIVIHGTLYPGVKISNGCKEVLIHKEVRHVYIQNIDNRIVIYKLRG